MSTRRILTLIRWQLRQGWRSPYFVLAIVYPFVLTAVVRLVFAPVIAEQARVVVLAPPGSAVAKSLSEHPGIALITAADEAEVTVALEAGKADGGLIVGNGFEAALQAGQRPPVRLRLAGASLGSQRLVIAAAVADALRRVAPASASVRVRVSASQPGLYIPMIDRLMPLLVLFAVMLGAAFMPSMAIVQGREEGTLIAALTTPLNAAELLLANGLVGAAVALFCSGFVVVLNGADLSAAVSVCLAVAAVMCAAIGLAVACVVRSVQTMMVVWKVGGILFFFPAILWLEPSMPQWLAQLGPTYYFLQPLHAVSQEGATLAAVGGNLAIGGVISAAFVALAVGLSGRLNSE